MKRLRLSTSQASHPKFNSYPLPKPFLSLPLRGQATGDDASVFSDRYLGVADGVGQWNKKKNGSAGLWSRLMINEFSNRADHLVDEPTPESLVAMLDAAYYTTRDLVRNRGEVAWHGSTTLLVSMLNRANRELVIANIGDSSLLLIRDGKIVFETEAQSHWFDCPFQIGHNSPDTPRLVAAATSIPVMPRDTIVASTDGLGDNVYPAQILEVVSQEGVSLEDMAVQLVAKARETMSDEWGESPFGDRAICEGIGYFGGKRDDVSVLVSRIEEVD